MTTTVQFQATFTSPTGANIAVLAPRAFTRQATLSEPEMLTGDFTMQADIIADDDGTNNPVQLNSKVVVRRRDDPSTAWGSATKLWAGWVFAKPVTYAQGGETVVNVQCLSKMGKLIKCLASIDGDPLACLNTPTQPLSAAPATLSRVINEAGGAALPQFAWFPPDSTGAYLLGVTTTLYVDGIGGSLTSGAVTIIGTTTHGGFLPAGFLVIGTEIIWYDGYQADGTGGRYQFRHCVRGCLGTTPAAHVEGATITANVAQKISPRRAVLLEVRKISDATWVAVPADWYRIQPGGGYIESFVDLLSGTLVAKGGPFDAVRGTWDVYDEDSVNAVTVTSVLTELLTESIANGGPGWVVTTDFVIDSAFDSIALPTYRLDGVSNTLEAITDLLSEVGLVTGNVDDAAGFCDDHANERVLFGFLRQNDAGSHDIDVAGMISREQDQSLANVYSAVEVEYEPVIGVELVVPERLWHPAVGAALGTGTVAKVIYQDEEKGTGDYTQVTTAGNAVEIHRIADGIPDTAWGLQTTNNTAVGAADVAVAWWDVTAVDEVSILLDARLSNNSTGPFHFEAIGITSFSSTSPPTWTAAEEVRLDGNLEKRYPYIASWTGLTNFGSVELKAETVGYVLQGIVMRWQGTGTRQLDPGNARRTFTLKKLSVKGRPTQTVSVQLTATANAAADKLYAPASYAKLVDTNYGQHRTRTVFIGPQSPTTASNIARLLLLLSIQQSSDERFECIGPLSAMPVVGRDTLGITDAYLWVNGVKTQGTARGLLRALTQTWDGMKGERWQFVTRDYTAGSIT